MVRVTKQKFEYYLETYADNSTFLVERNGTFIQYNWFSDFEIIASQTKYKGTSRVVYEVKI